MEVDEWLDSAEVTKLTTEWLGCSVGRAEQIVREAYTSGYVRKESALSRFNIRPGVLRSKQPLRAEFWLFNRDDYSDWLAVKHKGARPRRERAKLKSATPSRCREAITKYKEHLGATGASRSMDGFLIFAKEECGIAGQKDLRTAYRDEFKPSRGRPPKRCCTTELIRQNNPRKLFSHGLTDLGFPKFSN